MENLSLFDINEFSKGLKKFEEEWTMFEEKPKPLAPAGNAQANLAVKGDPNQGQRTAERPPMDKKEVDKLKQEAGSMRFTTVTFKAHSDKCDATSWNKKSGQLCSWCIEASCLRARLRYWQSQETASADTKTTRQRDGPKKEKYAPFRQKLDRATNHMCPKYKGVQKRMESGAEIFKADITSSDSDNGSEEEMSNPHCHKSCVNYEVKCEFPIRCKQRRQDNTDGPI